MNKKLNLIGRKFGKLLVTANSEARTKAMKAMFDCICDCGNKKTVTGRNLISGASASCGCEVGKSAKQRFTTHGRTSHEMFHRYRSMIDRCYNKNAAEYENYGGRGITVCQQWIDSIDSFIQDIGVPSSPTHSLDRKDNNAGYSPDNVRWATKKDQSINRRVTQMLSFNGVEMCAADWGRSLGMTKKAVLDRIRAGWPLELALTAPPVKRGLHQRGESWQKSGGIRIKK